MSKANFALTPSQALFTQAQSISDSTPWLDKNSPMGATLDKLEHAKTRNRAKAACPFRVMKRQLGHMMGRNRELARNTGRLLVTSWERLQK